MLRSKYVEQWWAGISPSDYERDSRPDRFYNCIAYAAGDLWHWWDDVEYWPPGATRGEKLAHLMEAFAAVGFIDCGMNFAPETGWEKVAIYCQQPDDLWTHAARLRPDGWWESKLGKWVDILHRTPQLLEGNDYGRVGRYMKRTLVASARARVEARSRARLNGRW